MKPLPHGLYEQLINTHLEEKLMSQGITISKDALKNFDSSVLLSQYLGPVLKKSLAFLEDSEGSTSEQIACCKRSSGCSHRLRTKHVSASVPSRAKEKFSYRSVMNHAP